MKKVSIMLLAALAVLFAFTACPAETKLEPATQEEIDNLAAYLAFFGHDRVLNDLSTIVTDPNGVTGLKLTKQEVSDTSVVFTLKATDYDYDGHADAEDAAMYPRLASGEYTLTFTGTTTKDTNTFTATSYKFDSANGITFEMAADANEFFDDYTSVTAVLTGVTGDFVEDEDAKEPSDTADEYVLTISADGKTVTAAPNNGTEFGMPTTGTIAIGEHAVDLTALKTAVKEFKEAAIAAAGDAQ